MKVQIIRVSDDYVLNVRYTDELLEDGTFADEAECNAAERCVKERGKYYLSADTYLKAV
jgi:hypothetical protein